MYLCKESNDVLNEQALVLRGDAACFKIHYWGVEPCLRDNPVHKHSFFEVCYVMDGIGVYTDKGIDCPLRKGTHFCSRPGVTHQIHQNQDLFLLYVAFELAEKECSTATLEAFRLLAEHGKALVPDGDQLPTASIWKSLLIREQENTRMPTAAISSLAYALLFSFLPLFGQNQPASKTSPPRSNLLLQQAKLYIRDNLAQPLSLQNIAKYLNVSERHLTRLFSGGIYENFTRFVRAERIRQASHLLGSSELSIKEISELSGFSSVHYFTRAFTAEMKMPPGQYRLRAKS